MNAIVVGVVRPREESPAIDRIFNDEASVRRLVSRLGDRRLLSARYKAGPGGESVDALQPRGGPARQLGGVGVAGPHEVPTQVRPAVEVRPARRPFLPAAVYTA
jgi:hypothetical protein